MFRASSGVEPGYSWCWSGFLCQHIPTPFPDCLEVVRATHLVSRDEFRLLCSDWRRDDEGGVLSRLLGKDLFDGAVAGDLLSIDGAVEEHRNERAVGKIKLAVLLQDVLRTSQF